MQIRSFHSLLLSLALCAAACGLSPVPLVASPRVPAAEGIVHIKIDDNGNTKLKVNVNHLAPPAKVSPGATVYVAWVSKDDSAPQNVGSFGLDSDLMGELETMTPLHGFLLTITAEAEPGVVAPQGVQVFSARIPD